MYCILNKKIALRSWVRSPYAYYVKGIRNAQRLKKEEYELLKLCDAEHDIENSELIRQLIERGLAT